VITLTSAVLADLSSVRTWSDLATYLGVVHRGTGMSYAELEKIGKKRADANRRYRYLPRSTVSDALSGKRPIKKDFLESLLAAWQVSPESHARIVDAWQTISAAVGQGPANAGRFDEASPRELGVHPAISTGNAVVGDDMPSYVQRDFDERLHDLVARGAERGCFVVLMGGSSCGKTRSLYEAVRSVVPDWWLVQPTKTEDIRDLLTTQTERTVLWLDELHRYLGADPPLRKADVVTLVRAGIIVVGTLWPTHYFVRKRLRHADGGDVHAEDRLVLEFADLIAVPDDLTLDERLRANELATTDSRIGAALAVSDAGLTQVLAAGPDLVSSWEQAPDPYGRAIITAAADARRLGVQGPLTEQLLTEAMEGYLSPTHRVTTPGAWLMRGLLHATTELHGTVSALTPVAGERAGSVEGYLVADYLMQHLGRLRRVECLPDSLWTALVTHARDPEDLRRLASTALARMRYGHAETALRRLCQISDGPSVLELIALLRRQDRLVEAIALADEWPTTAAKDEGTRVVRAELIRLQANVEQLRQRAVDDPLAAELMAEMLADGGRADALRVRAANGSIVAAEDLADLLADRGCLEELRERADGGHQYTAERLAEVLASLLRIDELQQRADAGDPTAALHLSRLYERGASPSSDNEVGLAALRIAADNGDEEAATELTALLLEAGDRNALLGEVNAGTYLAAERYVALLTIEIDTDRSTVRQIRAFGLRANGTPALPGMSP
jgi:hypothetical protein